MRPLEGSYGGCQLFVCADSIAWSQVSGTLPPGLLFLQGGLLTGTPSAAGTYTFLLKAADYASPDNYAARQFTLNASMQRTFRLSDRYSATLRIDSVNTLNHPTFPNWSTVIASAQFGLPSNANAMRSIQTTLRVTF